MPGGCLLRSTFAPMSGSYVVAGAPSAIVVTEGFVVADGHTDIAIVASACNGAAAKSRHCQKSEGRIPHTPI